MSDPPTREELRDLLGPNPAPDMGVYPAPVRVDGPASDDPFLIVPLEKT